MRTTSSFEIFPNEPSERELAKARWLRREGRLQEAEHAYRGVIRRQPALRTGWTECFELLRSEGRLDDALVLAADAAGVFVDEAFPHALKGAALIEAGRFKEALQSLEAAVDRDPDLALAWHELGYAAHKLGDSNRALLALDRAFALEPHTETLILRGKILRASGELYAAEVAFEAARHSAAHDDQQASIQREMEVNRRTGAFPPEWVRKLTTAEAWFAEHGTVVLASEPGDAAPAPDELLSALEGLARDLGWQFGQVVGVAPVAAAVSERLGVAQVPLHSVDPAEVPLLVAERPWPPGHRLADVARAIGLHGRGASFVLWHPVTNAPTADIVGGLEAESGPLALRCDPATALLMGQHPAARLAHRVLAAQARAGS